jgi:hypothetical protein
MNRLLLRLFPRAWRARYGEELLDLVSDSGLTPRAAADIARAGLVERVRATRSALLGGVSMTFGPAWRHPTAWAFVGLVALVPMMLFIAMSFATDYQLARAGLDGFAISVQSWLNTNRLADLVLVSLPAIAALFAGVPLVRLGVNHIDGSSEVSLSVRLRALNVVVVVVALGIGSLLVGHILFESVMQVGA